MSLQVMEQQTVSIAKAGITTTLNARTAILAAANPRYGRYNRRADADAHVALMKNINLPAALLSRFDLLFLLLDEVDADNDKALAAHVTHVHQHDSHPALDFEPLTDVFMRQYITIAKHMEPIVPPELAAHIVEAYVDMRVRDKSRASASGGRSTLTARQLLSILRMSQALARIEMREEVVQKDVDEAIRLVTVSKASVMEDGTATGTRGVDSDHVSRIWALVRDKALSSGTSHVMMADLVPLVSAAGLGTRQLDDFLSEYAALNLIEVNASRTRIDFVMLDE
jgi:DNA replication licensing factor MCM7